MKEKITTILKKIPPMLSSILKATKDACLKVFVFCKNLFINLAAKKLVFYALAGVIIVGTIVLVACLNTHERRYARTLLKAEIAFSENNTDKALKKYEKLLKIDETSMDGYLGILVTKEKVNSEDLRDTYENGLEIISEFPNEVKNEEKSKIVEYVLHESEIFAGDKKSRMNSLNKGWDITGGAADVQRILTELIKEDVDYMEATGDFDSAVELLDTYKGKTDLNEESLRETLIAEKAFYGVKEEVLAKVNETAGELCVSSDVTGLIALDGSDFIEELVETFADSRYVYYETEDEKVAKSGNGSGIFTFGEMYSRDDGHASIPYYFYKGEFKDGKREGNGATFMRTGENDYQIYCGEFKDDLPNGNGTYFEKATGSEETAGYEKTIIGNWSNGAANGVMTVKITNDIYPNTEFSTEINVVNGVPDKAPVTTEDYEILDIKENQDLIGVLKSSSNDFDLYITLWERPGYVMMAIPE